MPASAIDLDRLLKLRVAIGRIGEGDRAAWWNTKGQLGTTGARAVSRGFPRTHYFAQARAVFAVADERSVEVFEPKGCVTLWRLDEATEEAFDARWERWLDDAAAWVPYFQAVAGLTTTEVVTALEQLGLVSPAEVARAAKLRRSGAGVPLPGLYTATDDDVALLALGFARSEPRDLAVPYARRTNA